MSASVGPGAVRRVPGELLLRPAPFAAAALIAFNDFWLKPRTRGP